MINLNDVLASLQAITPDEWAALLKEVARNVWLSPWFRVLAFALGVLYTIRVIAAVYSGDLQNSEFGPVGIRFHRGQRLGSDTIMVARPMLPMNLDGVSANVRIFYGYRDASGKRRRKQVYFQKHMKLAISATSLPPVQTDLIYGYEVPSVATESVCFPPFDISDDTPPEISATPTNARDYAAKYKLIENWTEDDTAPLISLHRNIVQAIAANREEFITGTAQKLVDFRAGNFFQRQMAKSLGKKRVNVIGSFYLKLEFPRDPLFVLRKHPDRELKMTAWLTVLTSAFAIAMELFPLKPTHEESIRARAPRAQAHATSLTAAEPPREIAAERAER